MFLSRFGAAAGDDRSPWGNFWFEPVSMRTLSGVRVSPDQAMRLTAVYGCVALLAKMMATLPFCLYRTAEDGTKTPDRKHWLYRLFARQPNRWQTPFEFTEMLQGHVVLRGNSYCRIIGNARGEIDELVPIHPDRVSVEILDSGVPRYRVKRPNGSDEILSAGAVWQVRGLSSNGYTGINPIELARECVGEGLAMQAYSAQLFANDAKPGGGWIEFPGSFKDTAARTTFRESWQAAQAGSNRGKVAVLESGMKYHEIGLNNKDAQFLEVRQLKVAEICRLFGVPPHLVGDLSRATFSNIEQQSLEFVKYSMLPWAERWESSIQTSLLPDEEGLDVEFEMENLERGDSKARAEYYASGITNGWLTRNEARHKENLNALDGLDEPLQPLNMTKAGEDPAEDPPGVTRTPAPEPSDDAEARLAAVVRSNAQRLARRAVKSQMSAAELVPLIVETLAVPEDAAIAAVGTRLRGLLEHDLAAELTALALPAKPKE
jgi:HK97 family phage portal protein